MRDNFEYIASIKNPKISSVRKLKDKSYRKSLGLFVVEGERLIKDLPDDVEIDTLFIEKDKLDAYRYLINRHINDKICIVDEKVMNAMSDAVTPCGALATIKIKRQSGRIDGDVAVLDGVSDPGNMGTIIRTCAACGVKNILAINCVDCLSPKVVRASMGGIFKVNIVENTLQEALKNLSGHNVYCLDMKGRNIYETEEIKRPFAVVVGNESRGLSEEFLSSGKIVSLPMSGQMESLNAAVSMSIALYEICFGKNS